jgi:hypothetical protein
VIIRYSCKVGELLTALSHQRGSLAQQTVCWLVVTVHAAGAAVLRVRHCSLVICSTSAAGLIKPSSAQ